jgi:folate-binding protein YgfZ
MTELDVTTAISATTLAEYLAKSGLAPGLDSSLVPCFGALTPQQLDAPEAETGALHLDAAVHDLGWLRRIAVRGEDRFRWLSGMVTNGVETLANGTGAYNLVLNAQGRIQGDCTVWRDGDELEIEVTVAQMDALLAHFDRFIIMDDVELTPLSGESALGISGPLAEAILAELGIPALSDGLVSVRGTVEGFQVRLSRQYGTMVPHYALWAADKDVPALWDTLIAAGAKPVGSESLEALRVVEGIPSYGVDIQSRDLAQETSQERAISFTKGCYLGQEIVERVRSRGQVHRHLRSFELFPEDSSTLPPIGADLRVAGSAAESKSAGNLTSVAELQLDGARRVFAIGMIRAESEAGGRPLTYSGGTARILYSTPTLTSGQSAAEENA